MHSEDSQPIINKQGGIQLRDGHPAQRVKKLCKKLADQSNELGQLCSPSGTFCRVLEATSGPEGLNLYSWTYSAGGTSGNGMPNSSFSIAEGPPKSCVLFPLKWIHFLYD